MLPFEELERMTNELPPIIRVEDIVAFSNEGYVEYSVEKGRAFGLMLLDKESVSVMRLYMSKGTIFPETSNSSSETVIVFRGSVKARIDGKDRCILNQGDSISFKPDQRHGGEALEDTWLIAVSVPRIEGYPKIK